jgi:hypothetical protein
MSKKLHIAGLHRPAIVEKDAAIARDELLTCLLGHRAILNFPHQSAVSHSKTRTRKWRDFFAGSPVFFRRLFLSGS